MLMLRLTPHGPPKNGIAVDATTDKQIDMTLNCSSLEQICAKSPSVNS